MIRIPTCPICGSEDTECYFEYDDHPSCSFECNSCGAEVLRNYTASNPKDHPELFKAVMQIWLDGRDQQSAMPVAAKKPSLLQRILWWRKP